MGLTPEPLGVSWFGDPTTTQRQLRCLKTLTRYGIFSTITKRFARRLSFGKLSVRPDDVTVEDAGANMGKLYRIQKMLQNFEHLKAIITVAEIPFVLVNAMKWQNDLKLRIKVKGKKEEKADRKRRFRDIAGKLYPEITPALWNADATLIMHFGRFILQNNPRWVLENLPQQMHNRLF